MSDKIEIRTLKKSDLAAFEDYVKDWLGDRSSYGQQMVERYTTVDLTKFDDYVEELQREESSSEKPDWSTATQYFAFVNGKIAGAINCRWQIEKGNLLEVGGHIGYGVAPSFRGQGLAEKMTKFALIEYKKRGIRRVLITAFENNLASRRTIEKCGGVLENKVDENGEPLCRYWIDL
jgi:predicted acetyltransferase